MTTVDYLLIAISLLSALWVGTLILLFGALSRIRSYQNQVRTIRPLVLRQVLPVRNPLTGN